MNTNTASPSFIDVFASPADFFADLLNTKTKTWLALLVLLAVTSGGLLIFYSGMSVDWIIDQQMLHIDDASPSEEQEIRSFLSQSAPYTGILGSTFSAIFYVILISVLAGYFKLVGRKNQNLTYKDWFTFSVWIQIPFVVHMLGLMGLVFTANTPELSLTLVNYSSLNQLLLNLPIGHTFFDLAEALNLFYVWSIALAATGLIRWANLSRVKAWSFATLPYVVVFSLWGLLSL